MTKRSAEMEYPELDPAEARFEMACDGDWLRQAEHCPDQSAETDDEALAVLDMTGSTEGRKPLTVAERQARHRNRIAARTAAWRIALEAIGEAQTLGQARKLAWAALSTGT